MILEASHWKDSQLGLSRVSGGDPRVGVTDAVYNEVFPASAGVILIGLNITGIGSSLSRVSGGDPDIRPNPLFSAKSFPRQRG